MKRDGALESLWQHQTGEYPAGQNNFGSETFDVLIAGGGITGITTALELQKAGLKVVVAEAHNLCFGTSGGTTAHINNFFDTTYDQIRSKFGEEGAQLSARAAQAALELYRHNIETHSIDCGYAVKDGYIYAQDEAQVKELEKILESSRAVGVDVAEIDRIPIDDYSLKAIVFHEQAQIHPARYVYALAKAFEEGGGRILQSCEVQKVDGGETLEIETSVGTVKAKNMIWATHIPPGINLLHFRCAPYRSYAMAIKLKEGAYPDALVYDMYDPYHYYRTQEVDGQKYLIAGGEDHKTAHEENTEACFTRLEAHVREIFPVEEIAFRWSSQYFEPADGIPYIGHLPGNPDNVFVATGFGGNGITYSHVAAITLRDLLITGDSPFKDLYHPGRVKPVAGFANFIRENADVVKEFVGKRLSKEVLDSLSDLAAGEARVVKYEGSSMAIYKDEQGNIHAVNPTCTHAKCTVGWNSAEKSWDCPCHGARYGIDGNVLTGPATVGLEKVSVEELIEKE